MVEFSPRKVTVLADLIVFHYIVTLNAGKGTCFASARPESTQYDAAKTPPMRIVFEGFVTASEAIGSFTIEDVIR